MPGAGAAVTFAGVLTAASTVARDIARLIGGGRRRNLGIGRIPDPTPVSEASIAGQVLEKDGPVSRSIGTRRIKPGILPPLIELPLAGNGFEQRASTSGLFAGAHELEKVRLGDADAFDMTGVTVDRWRAVPVATDFEAATLATHPAGWTAEWNQSTTFDVSADASLPSGRGPLLTLTAGGQTFWSSGDAPILSDIEVAGLIRPVSAVTEAGIVVRGAGDLAGRTGYVLAIRDNAGSEIELFKYVAGVRTSIATAALAWSVGDNVRLRLQAFGSDLKGRAWIDGTAEPVAWAMEVTDADIATPGKTGMHQADNPGSYRVGEFEVVEGPGITSTDFADDILGQTPRSWTNEWNVDTSLDVTADAALPSGQGPVVVRTSGTAFSFWAWRGAGEQSDTRLRALLRPLTADLVENDIAVVARGSGVETTRQGYQLALGGNKNTLRLGKFVDGVFTSLATAVFAWNVNQNIRLRLDVVGDELRGKAWLDGSAEPSNWMVQAVDAEIAGRGRAGVMLNRATESFLVGEIDVAAAPLGLVDRQWRQDLLDVKLTSHRIEPEESNIDLGTGGNAEAVKLAAGSPNDQLPPQHLFASALNPDKVVLTLFRPQGLHFFDDPGTKLIQAMRVQFRRNGGPWVDAPELHFLNAQTNPQRFEIVFDWVSGGDVPADVTPIPAGGQSNDGINSAYVTTKAVTDDRFGVIGPAFVADSYFGSNAAEPSIPTLNITFDSVARCTLHLREAIYPKTGLYEFRIQMGSAVSISFWNRNIFQLIISVNGGSDIAGTYDFFSFGTGRNADAGTRYVFPAQNLIASDLFLESVTTFRNEAPVRVGSGIARIDVVAENRQLDALSAEATGLVRDHDGSNWTGVHKTSNPAPHYVDVLAGGLTSRPLRDALLDTDTLVAWRDRCARLGLEVSAEVGGQSQQEALDLITVAGHARRRSGSNWGVVVERSRDADPIEQVLTPLTSTNVKVNKNFDPRRRDGIRARFKNRALDYEDDEILVLRDGFTEPEATFKEIVRYDSIADADQVAAAARLDLRRERLRVVDITADAGPEAIFLQSGSMVGITSDVLNAAVGAGRIKSVAVDGGGDVTAVTLDRPVTIAADTLLHVRLTDGSGIIRILALTNAAGSHTVLTLETPAPPAGLDAGALAYTGPPDAARRMITDTVRRKPDDSVTLAVSDELGGAALNDYFAPPDHFARGDYFDAGP